MWRFPDPREGARACVACTALAALTLFAAGVVAQASSVEAALEQARSALAQRAASQAQSILAEALPAARALDAADARRADALVLMARAHRALGDLAEPEQLYREADPSMRAVHGAGSVEYARFLNEVGRYYHTRRKYDIAERFYREAFRVRVEQLGQEHAEVADSLCNLAILFENQARYAKAESYYKYALAIRDKLLGADDVRTTETREHFARLLYRMQRTEEAEGLAVQARSVRRELLDEATAQRDEVGEILDSSSGLRLPELIERTEPGYTEEARIARHEGTVRIQVDIDEDGRTHNPRVLQILGLGLDEQALAAVRSWRFRPARMNGRKAATRIVLAIDFSLL